jgi:hypothetical protein
MFHQYLWLRKIINVFVFFVINSYALLPLACNAFRYVGCWVIDFDQETKIHTVSLSTYGFVNLKLYYLIISHEYFCMFVVLISCSLKTSMLKSLI